MLVQVVSRRDKGSSERQSTVPSHAGQVSCQGSAVAGMICMVGGKHGAIFRAQHTVMTLSGPAVLAVTL